jgi:hypothetical protein
MTLPERNTSAEAPEPQRESLTSRIKKSRLKSLITYSPIGFSPMAFRHSDIQL